MVKTFLVVIFACLLSSCAITRDVWQPDHPKAGAKAEEADYVGRLGYFVGGIGQVKYLQAIKICKGKENVVQTEVRLNFVDWLLSAVTFGIFTPVTYRIYCAQ